MPPSARAVAAGDRTPEAAGYSYIGLDHFALPGDELSVALARGSLQRNFMGYTTHAECDLIGLGASSISHIGDSYSQNSRDLPPWESPSTRADCRSARGLLLDEDDVIRAQVIQQLMCRGVIDRAQIETRHASISTCILPTRWHGSCRWWRMGWCDVDAGRASSRPRAAA